MEVKLIDREAIIHLVDGLENFEKDKAIKSGLRSAVNVFRVRGRSNLRARLLYHGKPTNRLMNSFAIRVKRNKLGALSGFNSPEGNHAHLVDRGTIRRIHPITGTSGVMPANHFWEDAINSEGKKALDTVYNGVEIAIQRIKDGR